MIGRNRSTASSALSCLVSTVIADLLLSSLAGQLQARGHMAAPHRTKCATSSDVSYGYFYVEGSSSLCSYAYAVAAERLEMPSRPKMLLTCRATVFSLSTSLPAMARFV